MVKPNFFKLEIKLSKQAKEYLDNLEGDFKPFFNRMVEHCYSVITNELGFDPRHWRLFKIEMASEHGDYELQDEMVLSFVNSRINKILTLGGALRANDKGEERPLRDYFPQGV